ncbi:HAD family hydrolase [Erythrobacter sp. THAF29]|uniref:HAD family hydrolase n=1 Tax=Erythrobacter sp. THAF29 TaxID=2587851 RepID=UPI001268A011|nr:HAD family hydrolase [Erythrobacter sp. THAF29]QFT76700.1 hypothetical protein FIU90_03990 [Erythrobacter sp. THAF29]
MTETIEPHELPNALDRAPDGVKALSLDCFDTLLWRDCHAPTDVFSALDHVLPGQRIVGERNARKAEATLRRRTEIGMRAIYEHAMPNAGESIREEAIAGELDLEARVCFAFAPTVDLMREAKRRGIKVIIVSDTYLSARQLENLIRKAAGDEVADLIDRVFASCEAGVSKAQGLLAKALKAMKLRAHEVLHIGDNKAADFDASRALGVPALHLVQFTDAARQRLRFERACQQIAGEADGGARGLMPHRALIAIGEPQTTHPAQGFGFTVLGPVFHAFDRWLRREAEALEQAHGGTVHWLFLLRDGHLPQIVHDAGGASPSTARVELSRFTATAASLASRAAYDRHVALEHGLNPATLALQMLFAEDEIAKVVGSPSSDAELTEASQRLLAELRSGQRRKLTIRRARAFADRLIAHIRAAVDPQPGDTLMLVDLGYNGSAQNRVDALLSEAFGVQVAGRYLLMREMQATGLDKQGLIDPRHYDPAFLEAMCSNVAVIEQLATCEMGSVVDYTEKGEPIRKRSAVKGRQSSVRNAVQAGVVRFAEAATDPPVIRMKDHDAERGWREAAAGALARFMFLPQPRELEIVRRFEHDVNLGSERMVPLFDPERAGEGMRRRGLFYMKGSARMFLPAELAQEDMSTRLSLLVQKRFGLGLTYADHAPRTIALPAYYLSATQASQTEIEARATHDGYFAARIPVGEAGYGVALQLGAAFRWVEIASITCSPLSALAGGSHNDAAPLPVNARYEGFIEHAPGLVECRNEEALVLVMPDAVPSSDQPQMIEIVFRPIRHRGRASEKAPTVTSTITVPGKAA